MDQTHCMQCGATMPPGARFCLACGTPTGATTPVSATAVAREDRLSDSGALELRALLVAETEGEYEIGEEIGRGGMAVVYNAVEIHLGRPVAIKILPPELTFGKGATERFRREARTAAALDHPNIIPIYRISSGGRLFWYAMKFLEGRSLADVLEDKGLLTVTESAAILSQVADALDYAHERGVVHRDIKPGNIMLDGRGRVIVTDFGIAKELEANAGLTGSGNLLGTPYYMSPEQCRGTALTGAADQYSLAVMTYQMISGQLPFDADSAIDLLHKHCMDTPPPIDAILPDLPRHVINAINRGMSKRAEDRFDSTTAFVATLAGEPLDEHVTLRLKKRPSLTARLGALATATLPVPTRPRNLRIAGGLITALALGTVWAVTSRGDPDRTPAAASPVAADSVRDSAQAPAAAAVDTNRPTAPGGPAPARPVRASSPSAATAVPSPPRTEAATTTRGSAVGKAPDAAERKVVPGATDTAVVSPAPAAGPLGYLRVTVTNGEAVISINGDVKRQSATWADSVPAGRVVVGIAREGYRTQERTVTVRAGRATTVRFRNEPEPEP